MSVGILPLPKERGAKIMPIDLKKGLLNVVKSFRRTQEIETPGIKRAKKMAEAAKKVSMEIAKEKVEQGPT